MQTLWRRSCRRTIQWVILKSPIVMLLWHCCIGSCHLTTGQAWGDIA